MAQRLLKCLWRNEILSKLDLSLRDRVKRVSEQKKCNIVLK